MPPARARRARARARLNGSPLPSLSLSPLSDARYWPIGGRKRRRRRSWRRRWEGLRQEVGLENLTRLARMGIGRQPGRQQPTGKAECR